MKNKPCWISCLMLPLLFSCTFKPSESSSTPTKEEPGTIHMLNSFDTLDDLYRIKWRGAESSEQGSFALNESVTAKIREGKASLCFTQKAGNPATIEMPFSRSASPSLDKSDLRDIGLSVYQESEGPVEATLAVRLTGGDILLDQTYSLSQGQWTDMSFPLSSIALSYNVDHIDSVSVSFSSIGTFYLDDWKVEMGAQKTAEDEKYGPIVEDIRQKIATLPSTIPATMGNDMAAIYDEYASLPLLYRRIVPNYAKFLEATTALNQAEYTATGDGLTQKFLPCDTFRGLGQLSNALGGDLDFLYQKEIRYGEEEGSLELTFHGKEWNYISYASIPQKEAYDYVEFHFYNEDPSGQTKRVYFNWNGYVDCLPGVWTSRIFRVDDISSSGRMIVNELSHGYSTSSTGKLYIGCATLHYSGYEIYTSALKEDKPYTFEGAKHSETQNNGSVTLSILEDGDVTAYPQKKQISISSLENAYFNFYASKVGTLMLKDSDGNTIKEISAEVGWNNIPLAPNEYNAFVSITFSASANETYAFGYFGVYKEGYDEVKELIAGEQTLPALDAIKTEDVGEILHYLSLYAALGTKEQDWVQEYASTLPSFVEAYTAKVKPLADAYVLSLLNESGYPSLLLSFYGDFVKGLLQKETVQKADLYLASYGVAFGSQKETPSVGLDYTWEGSVRKEYDKTKGNVFVLDFLSIPETSADSSSLEIDFMGANAAASTYQKVGFFVYNPKSFDVGGYFVPNGVSWTGIQNYKFPAQSWTLVEVSAKLLTYRSFLVLSSTGLGQGWKITPMIGLSKDANIHGLNTNIASLPEASNVTTDEEMLRVLPLAKTAKASYDALSAEDQAKVTGAEKLTALLEKIEAKYGIVYGVDEDQNLATGLDYKWNGTIQKSDDDTYGRCFTLNVDSIADDSASKNSIQFENTAFSVTDYYQVFFYVYNPTDKDVNGYYSPANWNNNTPTQTFKAHAWTKVEVPASSFASKRGFLQLDGGEDLVHDGWKVSYFYGIKTSYERANLETIVDAFPSADEITDTNRLNYVIPVNDAMTLYESLSEEQKSLFGAERAAKLQALSKAVSSIEVIFRGPFSHGGSYDWSGNVKEVSSTDYGYAYAYDIESASSTDGLSLMTLQSITLEKESYFYIYNPLEKSVGLTFYGNAGSWSNMTETSLAAKSWTKVTLPSTTFTGTGSFIALWGVGVSSGWMITPIYAAQS